jgi:hypothetical protein
MDRRARTPGLVAILGVIGVIALGLAIQGFRPYHLRAAMPLMAVAVGVSAGLRPWLLPVFGLCVAVGGIRWTAPPAPDGGLQGVDVVGAALAEVDEPVQVEAVWFGDPVGLEPGAVVLSAVQHGLRPALQLRLDGAGSIALIVNVDADPSVGGLVRPDRVFGPLDDAAGAAFGDVRILRASSVEQVHSWLNDTTSSPVVAGGSFDWVKAFAPQAENHRSL